MSVFISLRPHNHNRCDKVSNIATGMRKDYLKGILTLSVHSFHSSQKEYDMHFDVGLPRFYVKIR